MNKLDIKWSTDHYDGYSNSTMLIGDYKGHRSIQSYNNNYIFPFAQLSLWWAKSKIIMELKTLT